jgi:hypothetical protein
MKTAKIVAKITVLAFTLCFIPAAGAQQGTQPQRPIAKTSKTAKTRKATSPKSERGPEVAAAAENAEPVINRRDPFSPLIAAPQAGGLAQHLPPGKAGLVIATVRVDGAVKSPNGMIAVVSNPEERIYFVHEGDRLYDGDVEKIGLDGVTFKENSKDAFGKPVARLVTKRIYPSAGEQQ